MSTKEKMEMEQATECFIRCWWWRLWWPLGKREQRWGMG